MNDASTDAALVAGHLAGDPSALGGIYDRYGDSLHDTAAAMLNDRTEAADVLHDVILIAADRLGQLRDPDRLKPWLFAILRNEVYARTKKRKRTIATDFSGADDGFDMADERNADVGGEVADEASGAELAELVRNAARGLDERDQLVLELSVRQGLEGQDLADALGVSANQSYSLVHRMRERVERSLSAYVVAKAGRRDCDDLDKLLGSWDGEFTVLIRKRVARHVDRCEVCDTRRRGVAAFAMFGAAPVYAAPPGLREQILGAAAVQAAAPSHPYAFTASDGFPQLTKAARRVAAWIPATAAACVMLIAAGVGFVWLNGAEQPDVLVDAGAPLAATTSTTEPDAASSTDTTDTTVFQGNNPRDPDATAPPTTTLAPSTTTSTTTTPTTTSDPIVDPGNGEPGGPTTAPPTGNPNPVPTPPPTPPPPPPTTSPPAPPPPVTTTTTTVAPLPGMLSFSADVIQLGATSTSGSLTISNTGDLPVDFAVTGDTGPFVVSPTTGQLAGGTSVQLVASIDRSNLPEGNISASIQVSGGGVTQSVRLGAQVERPPTFSNAYGFGFCSVDIGINVQADIADESGVSSAQFSVSGPLNLSGSGAMTFDSPTWYGFVSIPSPAGATPNGTWSWTVTATDTRGNVASTSGSFELTC